MISTGEKILLLRVGLGGDLVMITPALNALLNAFPNAEFHLLTTSEGQRVMKGYHPRLTQLWLYHRRFPQRLLLERQLHRQLRAQGYSRVYIFEDKPFYRRWLKSIAPKIYDLKANGGEIHYCEQCLNLVDDSLSSTINRGWIQLSATDNGVADARALLAESGIDSETMLVGLHPTFSGSSFAFFRDRESRQHRMWPEDSFAKLARLLRAETIQSNRKLAIIIDALPEDRLIVQRIVELSDNSITMLSAPPDFQRYKGLLKLFDVLVTPNTGPMHFAAALGTHIVGLFSKWSVEDCGPYVPEDKFEVLEVRTTSQPELGLAAISPELVCQAIINALPNS